MAEPLEWEFSEYAVSRDAIRRVEEYWNVQLPADYVDCVLQHNGGHPSRDVFDVPGNSRVFGYLCDFHAESGSYVLDSYEDMRDRLLDWIFPIADDPFGNMICLDYRVDRVNPSVVFWDHEASYDDPEAALTYVAASFTEFLGMLRVSH
jgi:hypothetical protein